MLLQLVATVGDPRMKSSGAGFESALFHWLDALITTCPLQSSRTGNGPCAAGNSFVEWLLGPRVRCESLRGRGQAKPLMCRRSRRLSSCPERQPDTT